MNLSIPQRISSALLAPAVTLPLFTEINTSRGEHFHHPLLESLALTPVFSGLVHLVQTSPLQVPT